MSLPASPTHTVPDHVPAALLRDIDPWAEIMTAGAEGYARAARFHQDFPPIFYATSLAFMPGCWVPRRAEDLRYILQNPEIFSSAGLTGFSSLIGEAWPLIPLEVDPPQHGFYRMLLNPLFTPKRVGELDADMRELARALLNKIKANGRCTFDEAFAEQFPVLIFLRLMGWPIEEAPKFVGWVRALVKGRDMSEVAGAIAEVAQYLRTRIAERRVAPTDDFTSYVLAAKVEDRPLTEDEVMGICFLIFIGGLDTVTSTLAFQFAHLARNHDQQRQLRENPELIPTAVEELLRAYSVVNMRRCVTQDVLVGDAPMKKGDFVLISTELADLDPEEFEDPTRVDFSRESIRHMAFSFGPHRCVGSHLARRELVIAMQEWLTHIPQFELLEPENLQVRAAGVFGLEGLKLQWNPAAQP